MIPGVNIKSKKESYYAINTSRKICFSVYWGFCKKRKLQVMNECGKGVVGIDAGWLTLGGTGQSSG